MKIERTVTVATPIEEVFEYLKDFENTREWDAGTISTTRISGDGDVGTRYRNVSRFLGRETELTYVLEEAESPRRLKLRGSNRTVTAHDTMTLTRTASGGTELHYLAEFDFAGPSRFVAPLLAPAFWHLGNGAEKGLKDALG